MIKFEDVLVLFCGVLMVVIGICAGCSKESGNNEKFIPTNTQLVNKLQYYKDTRTQLCFISNEAITSYGFTNVSFTYVPCTPEVEKLIIK